MSTVKKIKEAFNINDISAKIIEQRFRGKSLSEIEKIVFPKKLEKDFYLQYKDKIDDIYKLINSKKILQYTDYDADGILSHFVFKEALKILKPKKFYVTINDKEEGFGLKLQRLLKIRNVLDRIDVVFTSDCGSGSESKEALEYLKSLNKIIIVTDHHQYEVESIADIHINPSKTDFNYYSGAMVVYKIFESILYDNKEAISAAALSTITDVCPLIRDNRFLVKLMYEKNLKLDWIDQEINTLKDIIYGIAPKLNAPSRILNIKDLRLKLKDQANFWPFLIESDQERKKLINEIIKSLYRQAWTQSSNEILVLKVDKKYLGLFGLLSSRVCSYFKKPTIVGTVENNKFYGSARDFYSEIPLKYRLENSKDIYLSHIGGHSRAFGVEFDLNLISFSDLVEIINKNIVLTLPEEYIEEKNENFIIDLYMNESEFIKNYDQLYEMSEELFPFSRGFEPIRILLKINEGKIIKEEANKSKILIGNKKLTIPKKILDDLYSKNKIIIEINDRNFSFEFKSLKDFNV